MIYLSIKKLNIMDDGPYPSCSKTRMSNLP